MKFFVGSIKNHMLGPSHLSTPINSQTNLRIYAATKDLSGGGRQH